MLGNVLNESGGVCSVNSTIVEKKRGKRSDPSFGGLSTTCKG